MLHYALPPSYNSRMEENPYKPPQSWEPVRPTGVMIAALRGAKFGSLVGLFLGVLMAAIGLVVGYLFPAAAKDGATVGGALGGIALFTLYGAIMGFVVAGLVALLRRNSG